MSKIKIPQFISSSTSSISSVSASLSFSTYVEGRPLSAGFPEIILFDLKQNLDILLPSA